MAVAVNCESLLRRHCRTSTEETHVSSSWRVEKESCASSHQIELDDTQSIERDNWTRCPGGTTHHQSNYSESSLQTQMELICLKVLRLANVTRKKEHQALGIACH